MNSRLIAYDRLNYIVQQDRKTAPTGRWVRVRDPLYPHFLLTPGAYFMGRPLSDPDVFDEAYRYTLSRYWYKVRA